MYSIKVLKTIPYIAVKVVNVALNTGCTATRQEVNSDLWCVC